MQTIGDQAAFPEALVRAREQLFWDRRQPPPAIESGRFILKVMELGTWEMVEALEASFPKSLLIQTLQTAPCGALSPRSWNFWCLRLDIELPYPARFAIR